MSDWDEPPKKEVKAKPEGEAYKPKKTRKSKAQKTAEKKQKPKKAKSVVPEYVGPPKVGVFNQWFDNRGKTSVMFRGYNIRPGDGCWVTERAKPALEAACGMSKSGK